MSSLVQTPFRRYLSTSVNNLKKERRPYITKPLEQTVLLVKNNDIINYFKKPEDLQEIPAVHFIKKGDIINHNKLRWLHLLPQPVKNLSIETDCSGGQG